MARTTTAKKEHRRHAVESFHGTWTLISKRQRSKDDDVRMVHMAHASRHHWGVAGGPVNWAIGEWQVSHVYALLRREEPALFHARECLRICRTHGLRNFPLAYAYEALARASAVARRRMEVARFVALGVRAGSRIQERDDREQFFRDLRTVPGARIAANP